MVTLYVAAHSDHITGFKAWWRIKFDRCVNTIRKRLDRPYVVLFTVTVLLVTHPRIIGERFRGQVAIYYITYFSDL
jgi:hypothetical protein